MMAMEMYLSNLLGESSAEKITVIRDDAKVGQSRRRKFKSSTTQRSTSPWKPQPKSEAPTLPSRTTSTEDLSELQKLAKRGSASRISSTNENDFFFFEEEDYRNEDFDLDPFNNLSLEEDCILVNSKSSMPKRTSSLDSVLDTVFPRSSTLLDEEATSSSPTQKSLRTSTNILGQHTRHRSSDCLSLSHTQRLNLYGLIDDAEISSRKKNRCPATEAAPIKPFRKESNDDLAHPPKGNQDHLFDALDNVILNSTWEPLQGKAQTSNGNEKEILLKASGSLSAEETWMSLLDRPLSTNVSNLPV